jgi:hypothetical protein
MVEAGRHLKLLPISILDMHKVFGHIDMLYPPYLAQILAQILGLWATCGVKMM